jgi:hypothetical protein
VFSGYCCSTCRSLLILLRSHCPRPYRPLLALALRLDHVTSIGRATSLGLWSGDGGFGFCSSMRGGLIWSLQVRVDAFGVDVAGTDTYKKNLEEGCVVFDHVGRSCARRRCLAFPLSRGGRYGQSARRTGGRVRRARGLRLSRYWTGSSRVCPGRLGLGR